MPPLYIYSEREREKEGDTENVCPSLVHSLNAQNSLGQAGLNLAAGNSTQVSHLDGNNPITQAITTASAL